MEGHHKTELKKKSKKNSSGLAAGISGTVVNPALARPQPSIL